MTLRRALFAALVCSALFGLAVFLPWAGTVDGAVQVAGWGSGDAPRLRGMLVIACSGVAVSCLSAATFTAPGRAARAPLIGATGAAMVALVASLSVAAGAADFVAAGRDARLAGGLVVALFGEVLTVMLTAFAVAEGVEASPGKRPGAGLTGAAG